MVQELNPVLWHVHILTLNFSEQQQTVSLEENWVVGITGVNIYLLGH